MKTSLHSFSQSLFFIHQLFFFSFSNRYLSYDNRYLLSMLLSDINIIVTFENAVKKWGQETATDKGSYLTVSDPLGRAAPPVLPTL